MHHKICWKWNHFVLETAVNGGFSCHFLFLHKCPKHNEKIINWYLISYQLNFWNNGMLLLSATMFTKHFFDELILKAIRVILAFLRNVWPYGTMFTWVRMGEQMQIVIHVQYFHLACSLISLALKKVQIKTGGRLVHWKSYIVNMYFLSFWPIP